jgi:ATP-dependent helicase/nuclease subunit A
MATTKVRVEMSKLFVVGQGGDQVSSGTADALPPDAAARERALDATRSWIVEAPAGSGKTGLLIQRYLKLLAEGSVTKPGQVLAITFTKKAAAEIRERVVSQLESAARGDVVGETAFERETRMLADAVLEKDARLEWGLLASPQRMSLKTIDSLCALIVSSMPVLSGGGGAMAPLADALPLYQMAARRTVLQLGGADPALDNALRLVLLHRDGNLAECERLLAEMLELREQWGALIPLGNAELNDAYLDSTVLPKLERTLEQTVCAGLTRLAKVLPDEVLRSMAWLAGEFAELPPYKPEIHPFAICRGMKAAPEETVEHLEHWQAMIHLLVKKDGEWRKRYQKNDLEVLLEKHHAMAISSLIESLRGREDVLGAVQGLRSLPPAKYPPEQWVVAKALFRLLSRALVELQLVFAERGECDFAELALLARSALRQTGGVLDLQEAWGMELRHLLVDEMQDTSTSQYELIQLLTQDWDGKQQTVFLVGDPKQSIYLFRQARVERFVRTMQEQRLGDLPMECLRLTANFRSQRDLVESFNEDFSLLFPSAESVTTPDEVPYTAAVAVRKQAYSAVGMRWHTRVIEGGRIPEQARLARGAWQKDEAQQIRAIAKEWRAKPLPPGRIAQWKIAVLVQTRRHLLDVVTALKEDDGEGAIPFCAVKIDELAERSEVMDLFALTRALLHPADKAAWLAVLRAPWCGLSLVDLHTVAGGDDTAARKRSIAGLLAERQSLLSKDGQVRVGQVISVMEAANVQRGRVPMVEWVERTWRTLGGDVSLTDAELGNTRQYLQLLDEMASGAGGLEVAALTRRLKKLYAQAEQSVGAVDLMTIHGAKGLEWDVVMLPGLARAGGSSRTGLLVWNEIEEGAGDTAHGMLAPIAGRGEKAKELNRWMKDLNDAREAAERKRLFYVACTRTREELHLFAAPDRSAKGAVLPGHNNLLKAAWPAAERHFVARASVEGGAKVLHFETPAEESENGLAIAAGAETATERPAMLERLPLSFNPVARFRSIRPLVPGEGDDTMERMHFERPEGSFAARSFGNAMHAFLELVAKHFDAGVSVDELATEVATWSPRMEAVLRSDGLPSATVKREAQRLLAAVKTALTDEVGRWVLGAREQAASEYGFTTWGERRRSFRLDRMFVAGTEPLAAGSECLWIVDYKTGSHGRGIGVEAFLESEREKYGAQMESYAAAMKAVAKGKELRVALYYPMLPKLLWWRPGAE